MHGVTEEANNKDHNGRSCIVRVTNTGQLIMQNTRHICSTPRMTRVVTRQTDKKGSWMIRRPFHGDNSSQTLQKVQTINNGLKDTYGTL